MNDRGFECGYKVTCTFRIFYSFFKNDIGITCPSAASSMTVGMEFRSLKASMLSRPCR
jgi:hypothetical protein